ncbi:MAG: ABC transporter ATP-binding protein [Lachnospiraceae bacterium]|nr:ABC transporter ATP-binding protein [Robinsoniella sp.]MDY3765481.1 ABC transporter ATP-binding protein [Lachnospiraceae bacterium]
MKFVNAEEITFSWGDTEILHKVSMEAEEGRFIGVIGPNGSGKSTFLKCVYRVWKQNGGTIWIDGKETSKLSYKETAKLLGVVAQHNIYDFDFSVKEVVLMGRSPHKKLMEQDNAKDYEIVRKALKEVGMEEFEKRSFAGLSGGEQQRVILARALAQETKGFILDEPTNHLDIKYQLQLLNTVKRMNKTVLAAFHDLNIAALYCDEIYVMKDGKIFAYGSPKEILTEDLIWNVYEVKAQILEDKNGNPHIIYCP